jgi:crotonobetainyl-CoA:carnitine CoA-transferase CaiB-like acyl-CoA transferase
MAAFEAQEMAAARVYDFLDRVADEQLAHREVFISVDDQQVGHMTVQAPVPRFSATRRSQCRGLPGAEAKGRGAVGVNGVRIDRSS